MMEARDRISDKGALERAKKIAGQQMRGENLPGDLNKNDTDKTRLPNFANNLQRDKAAFYDPLAGR